MTLRDDYNRDGYVRVRYADGLQRFPWTEILLRNFFNASVDWYIGFLSVSAKNIDLQRMLIGDEIHGSLIDLGIKYPSIISQPVLHVMSPALRIPDGYYGTEAHQDWTSTQGSIDCVTVWIALTDAGIGNFPLEVIPGSHLDGLREGKVNGSVLEVEADDKDFVPIECKAGDVIFLSGFIVHRTGKGKGFRVAVSQRFDNASEPTFIERGYPCAQKRIVDREVKWKPTVEQVRKIYE